MGIYIPLCFFLSKLDEAMLGLEVKQKLVHLSMKGGYSGTSE